MRRTARALALALLSVLAAPGAAAEACGAPGAEAGGCSPAVDDEETAMLQVKAGQSGRASGDFDYKSFQIGDWPSISAPCMGTSTGYQSPINIAVDGADYKHLPHASWPEFYAEDGGCSTANFLEKKTAWQVNFYDDSKHSGCDRLRMKFNGKVYVLVQFHFHTLSEDTLDFKPFPLQMHMVHLAEDGSIAVVGVLIRTQGLGITGNPFLKTVFETGFETSRTVNAPWHGKFNPYAGLLHKMGRFWHYEGSLTSPPCSEGLDFLIAQDPVVTSASYVEAYMSYLKGTGMGNSYGLNHRPIQPLKDRKISSGHFTEMCPSKPAPPCGKHKWNWIRKCLDA